MNPHSPAAEHNVYQFPSKTAFDACDFTAASVISDGLNQTNATYAVQTTSYFACEVWRALLGGGEGQACATSQCRY